MLNNNQLTTTLQVDWNLLFGSMIMFVFVVGMIRMVSRELLTEHHSNIGRQLKPATEAKAARDYWDAHREVSDDVLNKVKSELGITERVEITFDVAGKTTTDFIGDTAYINIRSGPGVTSESERLLHELKHAQQHFQTRLNETEAIQWASSNVARFPGLIKKVSAGLEENLGNPQTQLKTSTNLHEVITNLRPQFPTFKQAIDQSLEEGREIGYVIDDKYRLTGPFTGSAKGVRFPLTKEELENLGAIGTFHTHIEREIPVPSRLNWMWMGLRDDKVLCVGGKARERYYLYVGLRKDDLVEEKTISLEYTKVDNPGETILPSELVIPSKEFREQVLADIRRSQPRQALEALSTYYDVVVPSFVTMAELRTISPCLYGEAEDAWGIDAEAMYMPQRQQRRVCQIRTNEDFIVVSPEVDITEYPMHVIEEFYHHLFNHRPKLLKDYPHDEEFACMMVCRSWRVN